MWASRHVDAEMPKLQSGKLEGERSKPSGFAFRTGDPESCQVNAGSRVEWQGRLAIPLEERWRRYKEARERIFKDHQQRFKKRKMERQEVQRMKSQIESYFGT